MIMAKKIYECGTLRYSLGGLLLSVGLILFAFFSFTLTTNIINNLIPLHLKDALGADNKTITLIIGTIGGIFNITICPIVSFKSDRYRSRWGRRIPFILWTLIPYVLSITGFAFSSEIAVFFQKLAGLSKFAPTTITIVTIGIIMAFYQFFYMFVGSVIYYIYNDVIPVAFQARVVGAVQVACTVATTVFNLFLLKYSLSHFKLLMLFAAIIYTAGVGVMCFLLKEPDYPPVPEKDAEKSSGSRGVLTFVKESFSHPFYWYAFISTGLMSVSTIGTFLIFFNQNMGLSLDSIGKLFGIQGVINTALSIAGAAAGTLLIDRWHPVRVYLFGLLLSLLEPLFFLKFLFATPPAMVFWWSSLIMMIFLRISGTFYNLSSMPMLMRTYPQSRFGQFCSACAMLRSILVLVFGLVLGACIDLLKYQGGLGDFAFRYIWLWRLLWMLPSALFFILLYRQWLRLGGDKFRAPAPWSETGYEEMPVSKISHPTEKLVKRGIVAVGGAIVFHIVLLLILTVTALRNGNSKYFLSAAFPLAIVTAAIFVMIRHNVLLDLRRIRENQQPCNGIPHHGFLFLCAVTSIGLSGIGFYQSFSVISNVSAVWFWCAESLILLVILLMIILLIRIERGYSEIDKA
ncbi:MAG: MFS transporter [Lentisphaerae bacterium]|nr:MFS transporter [Lentisphaerota bacterium]MBE6390523.1 MFS transporter [Lentisphaerota bacterium]